MKSIDYFIENNKQAERLFLLHLLGIITAVKNNVITLDEAERIIFMPATMRILEENKVTKEIIDIIHLGTELEDVLSIIPHKYEESILEIEALILKELDKNKDYEITAETCCTFRGMKDRTEVDF